MKVLFKDFDEKHIEDSLKIIEITLGKKMAEKASIDFKEGCDYSFVKRKTIMIEDKVIGLGGLYRLKNHPENILGICWFAIHPKYQNKGLGTQLMDWYIKEGQYNSKILFVWSTEEAVSFYEKFGFKKSNLDINPKETNILLVKYYKC